MAQITRLQRLKNAKLHIKSYFENSNKKIFTELEMFNVLNENRDKWLLAKITKVNDFTFFLKENEIIKDILKIKLPLNKSTTRYITGNYYDYEIGASIYPKSYFSHYTAMYLNKLTYNTPKVIYVNKEQSKKYISSTGGLTQENINKAFKNSMRKTNQIATFKDVQIYMLSGKNTSNLGVVDLSINGKKIFVTGVERTLIDIVVRPEYSGGPTEILEAYKLAKEHCSINLLIALLRELNYVYPYHQSIGFYLEKAGYKESILKRVEQLGIEFDFYLQYRLINPEYSKRWKLFFPKGI